MFLFIVLSAVFGLDCNDVFSGHRVKGLSDTDWPMIKTCIQSHTFSGYMTVDMSRNDFTYIPFGVFNSVSGPTTSFNFTGNKISYIEPYAFDGTNCQMIALDSNQLTMIGKNSFTGVTVTFLYLQHNQIRSIDSAGFQDASVNQLLLSSNGMTEWKREYLSGATVFALYLDHNSLTQLEYGSFSALNISDGEFSGVDLSYNRISLSDSPAAFAGISMNTLDLSYNRIDSLKANSFVGLNCVYLNLGNNLISTIDSYAFEGIVSLSSIATSHNVMKRLPSKCFSGLSMLTILNMDFTFIESSTIDGDVFDDVPGLKRLILNHNNLSVLPKGFFTDLTSLETLDLSYNRISALQDGLFPAVTLDTVDLKRNPLKCIPEDLLADHLSTDHNIPRCATI